MVDFRRPGHIYMCVYIYIYIHTYIYIYIYIYISVWLVVVGEQVDPKDEPGNRHVNCVVAYIKEYQKVSHILQNH